MINRLVIAAGGTGGHIFPAIAVAEELKKMNTNIDIQFVGAKGRIEESIIPRWGYKLKTIEIKGFRRSLSPQNLNVAFKLRKAIKESRKILEEFKPEIVFGTGGFVSGPVLWASKKLGNPTVIMEGNYYPGITVKYLSKKADKVIINFEGTKRFLKNDKNVEIISYPVRESLKVYSKKESSNYFRFDENKKILFILGGSQGASSINRVLMDNFDKIVRQDIQMIWQTGKKDYEEVVHRTQGISTIHPIMFIDNIDYAYSATDLIVCRAGISTVMELASFGVATIFVPYAFASDNHQEKNARALVESNAAEIILDKNLHSDLVDKVINLIRDEKRLIEMRTNISKFADKNAASKIASLLTDLAIKHLN